MKHNINEIRRMQQLAGLIKENQDPGMDKFPEERLEVMVSPDKLPLALNFLQFCEELGVNIADELILQAIKSSTESNDPNELLTIMADTMGNGEPDPFDGVFSYSDIENAIKYSRLPGDIANMITDDDRIRSLERG